ncbi:MAG TPA: peptide deformylase [Clostridiales bacterium]|nr:peptide deformylase [Clostridiales bacterium]
MILMLEVKTIGEEVLKQKAKRIFKKDIVGKKELIKEMTELMRVSKGIGIAAPQVGVSERVVIIEIEENRNYPDLKKLPLTVMINPKVTPIGKEKVEGYEGCLSVPEIRGVVARYKKILVQYLDENSELHKKEFEDLQARVVQHEVDHLAGIVFIERVQDKKTFITYENYKKYVLRK